MVRIALAGAGAIGRTHLDALATVDDVTVAAVVSIPLNRAREVAARYGVPSATADLADVLAREDIDAVVLATPTPLHAEQAIAVLRAGKHVLVEIPVAGSWPDAERVAAVAAETGLVCMAGHTRRFNPSHRWIHRRIAAGQLRLHQLAASTYFLRRTNTNALGEPRDWTDHLLWHHAAHTVDLLRYQTGAEIVAAQAMQGPPHPELGVAMDMAIQLKTGDGTLCAVSLSFNNDGPLGTVFRYIGDTGTYLARYDDLVTGDETPVDTGLAPNGVAGQDREFVAAILDGREPEASVATVLPGYRVLAELAARLAEA